MADSLKSCMICGGAESDGELLRPAPCGHHFVCPDDIATFFERATHNESLFPPKCCGQIFMLQDYEDYIPFEISWTYQVKEHGEYAILAKFRVYCANPFCGKFLHPSTHITDTTTNITYAICEDKACFVSTCTCCKMLLDQGTRNHVCENDEMEEKFKKTVTEKGYQQCTMCGAIVELMEACNHITCECGHDFCYICGKDWIGLHGCPHYGPATYDEEGHNQDGYHRDTGLNHEGLTRQQEIMRRRGEDPDGDDDEGEVEENEEDWEVLQHIDPAQRVTINILDGDAREDALDQLRIMLFETQGIMFGQDPPRPAQQQDEGEDEEDEEEEQEDEDHIEDDAPEIDPHDDGDQFDDEHGTPGGRFTDDQSEHDEPLVQEPLANVMPTNNIVREVAIYNVGAMGEALASTASTGEADASIMADESIKRDVEDTGLDAAPFKPQHTETLEDNDELSDLISHNTRLTFDNVAARPNHLNITAPLLSTSNASDAGSEVQARLT